MKPTKKKREYFDYNECNRYLETKYNCNHSDYASKFGYEAKLVKKLNKKYKDNKWANDSNRNEKQLKIWNEYLELCKETPPYLNFWHWVIERCDVQRGGTIYFDVDTLAEIKHEWIREIYKRFLDEFGEDGYLEMVTDW